MKAIASLLLLAAISGPLHAGTEAPAAPVEPAPPDSRVHFLLQLDVSDHYITPRGLNVENEGVIFQPLLLSFWNLYSNKGAFLSDVTLTAGVWSSIHTELPADNPFNPDDDPGHWNEFDPILGLTFGLGEMVKFETNYTAFKSMTDAYDTSHHLELKLKLDDSKWMGGFALNPYIAFWKELDNKATVVFDPLTSDESYYFTVGINPAVKVGPVKLEFPTYINIVDSEFYQRSDGSDGGGGIAVLGTGVKASVPLTFIPQEYGFWTAYAVVKYYHLSNDGLKDGNIALGGGDRDNLVQFHCGLSIFF